jgi:hypothetical protein
MDRILAYVDFTVAGYAAVFVLTLVFSTKIKDFFSGVPSDLRASLSSIETSVKADVKSYQADLVAKIAPAPKVVVKPAVKAAATGPTGVAAAGSTGVTGPTAA